VDPSDRERINPGSGSSNDGTDEPTHASGQPEKDDRWLRSVVHNSSEIVTIVDPDGTLRYANPAWQRVLGYDPEEEIGKMNVLDHVHPEDLPHVLEETEKAFSEGGVATNEAEYRFRHKDGSWRWVESMGAYLLDDPHVKGVVVTSRDVTERKALEEELEHRAFHDPLTDLPNRYLFMDRLGHALARTQRRRGRQVAVLFMDLDGFKVVNDSLGHETGDGLLVAVSERLKGA
jgi:PAS domain S-box-containing protein